MSEDEQRSRRFEISEELARAERVPDDLDATQREPYTIPSTRRRRISAVIHVVAALLAASGWMAGMPIGMLATSGIFLLLAVWHAAGAWRIEVLDPQALESANRAVDYPVGHASAAVGFDTWRARPVWNVLVFDADEPPSRRGLVRVDATSGEVLETYTEEVSSPEF